MFANCSLNVFLHMLLWYYVANIGELLVSEKSLYKCVRDINSLLHTLLSVGEICPPGIVILCIEIIQKLSFEFWELVSFYTLIYKV